MKHLFVCLILTLALLTAACSDLREPTAVAPNSEAALAESIDAEAIAWTIMAEAGWSAEEGFAQKGERRHWNIQFERTNVVDDIFHYSVQVPVGPGEFDVIGIHRVVRERRPNRPIRSRNCVFLQHGDIKDFTGMFLPGVTSPTMPDDFGLAVTLARADIDVWGIDQGWALVPAEVDNFDFMFDWGLDRQAVDLNAAIRVARLTRLFTGNGYRKVNLLGYSSGSVTGLALLNSESQMPPGHRQVAGFIAGDYAMLSDDPIWIELNAGDLDYYMGLWDAGIYQSDSPFPLFGFPARDDPDGPSDLIPGLTNLQAAIGVGAWPAYAELPYHFLGGIFDEDGTPIGLQYTDVDMWVDFMVSGPPYESLRFIMDYLLCVVAPEDVPWDDHLGDVTVPILYLSADGGGGPYSMSTLDVLGSTDVTLLEIGFHPPEEAHLEFAHVDLFIANDAPTLVYEPLRDWLLAHRP